MKITVRYLGGSRCQAGCESEEFEFTDRPSIRHVAETVAHCHPQLAALLDSVRWARNFEFAALDEALNDGDEVALLPPVAGGIDRAALRTDPIDPQQVVRRVQSDGVGATVLFVGTVRSESRGQAVDRLRYEAYTPMAQKQLEKIAAECAAERPGSEVAVDHRYGDLRVGDVAVAIAAAAAHRDDAFYVCRQMIERIKRDVPIWKQEFTPEGQSWVGWGGG